MWNEIFPKAVIILLGYTVTMIFSGIIVNKLIGNKGEKLKDDEKNLGRIIGKCENILAITFILAGEVTGLALIFAGKSIIRSEDFKTNSWFYLGGTLVNLCFSILMGYLIKMVSSIEF